MFFGVLLAVVIIAVVFAFLVFYGALSWGFVFYKFWEWFLIPAFALTFPEVVIHQITFPLAVGLLFIVSLFRNQDSQIIKDEYKNTTATTWGVLLAPWVTLFIGWLVKSVIL